MIFDRAADVVAALAPLGLPVRLPLDPRPAVGPCYLIQPPTAVVTVTGGQCAASALELSVVVVAPNGENTGRLMADTDRAVLALAAAGLLPAEASIEPAAYETPDTANPVPAYTVPCTA